MNFELQVSANAKLNVVLTDISEPALQKAQKSIDTSLRRVAKKKHADDAKVWFFKTFIFESRIWWIFHINQV